MQLPSWHWCHIQVGALEQLLLVAVALTTLFDLLVAKIGVHAVCHRLLVHLSRECTTVALQEGCRECTVGLHIGLQRVHSVAASPTVCYEQRHAMLFSTTGVLTVN